MAHCVQRKPCGNGEDFVQYPVVPMHMVTKFGEIHAKFVRTNVLGKCVNT